MFYGRTSCGSEAIFSRARGGTSPRGRATCTPAVDETRGHCFRWQRDGVTIARRGMASRAGGARGAISLDLLSAAVERAEGGMAELATARAADHPSSGGLHTSRRGDLGGDNGPNDSAGEWSDGESIDSDEDEIDVEEVVRVVTRMAKEGPTITVVPVDRKHHDVNELVRLNAIRAVERRRRARPGVDAWLDSRLHNPACRKTRPSGNLCISLTPPPARLDPRRLGYFLASRDPR